jgi:hypothetical protein
VLLTPYLVFNYIEFKMHTQTHYIDKILNNFSYLHDKISHVPYNSSLKFGINKN